MGSETESQNEYKKPKQKHVWTFYIFSKTVQAIGTTFYSHSTSDYGTMCAIRSKPYGSDLRRKAKIDSKNPKKPFWTFHSSSKTAQAIETIFYSHSTSYYGTMCAIRSKPYGSDLRRKVKIDSKNPKKPFWTFHSSSKTAQAIETIFYSHSTSYYGTMCAVRSKQYGWDLRKEAKISSKNPKKNMFGLFLIFSKTVQAIETTFYSYSTSYYRTMCAIRSKPYGWDLKKKATISSENTKKHVWTFFKFLKNCAGD